MLGCPRCRKTYPDDQSVCPDDGLTLLPVEALPAAEVSLAAGTMVGEYRIEKKLGAGTFGEVYAGEHPLIGKHVAIKVLHRKFSSDAEVVSRFISEARAVNRIRHRNIIDIFSFGLLDESRHYFVMELVRGLTLGELLAREPVLPIERAMPIFRGIAAGLDAAHEAGVTHRDLKPENIFLAVEKDGVHFPKLLDFGIAKLASEDVAHRTATGVAMGTPRYMSPEQCRGKPVDHRADIYALGVLIHEVLTGQPPFEAETAMDLLFKHSLTPAPTMSSMNPELPPELDAPVLAMLAKRPKDRPESAGAAVSALFDAALAAGLPVAQPASAGLSSAGSASAPAARSSVASDEASQQRAAAKTVAVRGPRAAREPGSGPQTSAEPEPPTVVDSRPAGARSGDVVSGDAATVAVVTGRSLTEVIPTSPGGTHLNEESIPDGVFAAESAGATARSAGTPPKTEPSGGPALQGGGDSPQGAARSAQRQGGEVAPPPPKPAAPPKRPWGPMAIGAAGVVVALVVVLRNSGPGSGLPAAPASASASAGLPAAAPGTVTYRIAATPADAVAVIGERRIELAREPQITLPRGAGSVVVLFEREGYDPTSRFFDTNAPDTDLATVTLMRAATAQAAAPAAPSGAASGKAPVRPKDSAASPLLEAPEYRTPR